MKNNSVINIQPLPSIVKTKSTVTGTKKLSFAEVDNDINQLWQMYQAQLQRNGELMSIIDRQQQFIQQVINKGILTSLAPEPIPQQAQISIPLPDLKELSVDKLEALTNYFKNLFLFEIKRLDGMHGIIKMLYTLHQIGGIAFPEQLFEKAKMGTSTGFRHTAFLKRKFMIKCVGGKYDTRYKITGWGKKFLNGTLEKGYDATHNSQKEEIKNEWAAYYNLDEHSN